MAVLEGRVTAMTAGSSTRRATRLPRAGVGGAGGGDEDRTRALEMQVDGLTKQGEALKRSFRGAIATKDEEIEILRRMTLEQQETYEQTLDDIRDRLSDGAAVQGGSSETIAQLRRDNE